MSNIYVYIYIGLLIQLNRIRVHYNHYWNYYNYFQPKLITTTIAAATLFQFSFNTPKQLRKRYAIRIGRKRVFREHLKIVFEVYDYYYYYYYAMYTSYSKETLGELEWVT